MPNICIFCGSSPGKRAEYMHAARALGQCLAERKITLIYGASTLGTMGALAQGAQAAGGKLIGIIPRTLASLGTTFSGLDELHVVDSLMAQKALELEMANGFISLPGGFGTLGELFEILTWIQLDGHLRPCGLLNVAGYYDHLLAFLDEAVSEGFLTPTDRARLHVDATPEGLLDRLIASDYGQSS